MNTLKPNTKNDAMYRSCTSLLSVLALAALLNAAPPALGDCDCESPWIIDCDEHCVLTADCTVDVLIIRPGGKLYTRAHTLTVTQSSGLIILGPTGEFGPGELIVDGAGTVVLSGGGTSTVNGELNLGISGSTLNITASCMIDGSGAIDGDASGAQILIEDGVTFTSTTNITGILAITERNNEDATFINGSAGLVHANKAGTLAITTNSLGVSAGNWQVSVGGAFLWLNHGNSAGTHGGNFTVSAGTLDVRENVCTTGNLSFTGGTIAVAAGKSFRAGGTCPSQSPQAPAESDP